MPSARPEQAKRVDGPVRRWPCRQSTQSLILSPEPVEGSKGGRHMLATGVGPWNAFGRENKPPQGGDTQQYARTRSVAALRGLDAVCTPYHGLTPVANMCRPLRGLKRAKPAGKRQRDRDKRHRERLREERNCTEPSGTVHHPPPVASSTIRISSGVRL
jgi:hypothetical protein